MLSLDEQKKKIKKEIWESYIVSILLIIFALVLLFKKEDIIGTLVIVVGFIGIVVGTFNLLMYTRLEKSLRSYSNDLSKGLLMILFGGIAILKNTMIANILAIVIGAYLIYKNVNRIQICFHLDENEKNNYWKYLAALSIGCIILGLLIIMNPWEEKITLSMLIAICLIASEGINIIQNFAILLGIRKKKNEPEIQE